MLFVQLDLRLVAQRLSNKCHKALVSKVRLLSSLPQQIGWHPRQYEESIINNEFIVIAHGQFCDYVSSDST